MNKQEIIKNTTFVLSGHNIKWFAVLGLESLIKQSRLDRSQVLYFDDFSTDGTREELESRGIKVISWDKAIFRNFKHSVLREDLCVRVDQIITCICRQIETKYVCVLDGDTAYSGDIASFILDKAMEDGIMPDFFGISRAALTHHDNYPFLERNIWQNYMWFDATKLNNAGVTSNSLSEIQSYYDVAGADIFNDMYDTGVVFYNNLMKTDAVMKLVEYIPGVQSSDNEWVSSILKISNHLGWLSSSMRDDKMFSGDWIRHKEKLRAIISSISKELYKENDIDEERILFELTNNIRKSPICEL